MRMSSPDESSSLSKKQNFNQIIICGILCLTIDSVFIGQCLNSVCNSMIVEITGPYKSPDRLWDKAPHPAHCQLSSALPVLTGGHLHSRLLPLAAVYSEAHTLL